MSEFVEAYFKQFDQVTLVTTRNVNYLSAKPGIELSPRGIWSVAGIISQNELLLVKNGIVIKIPSSDVLKVEETPLDHVLNMFGRLLDE